MEFNSQNIGQYIGNGRFSSAEKFAPEVKVVCRKSGAILKKFPDLVGKFD
jgi:hypothetical protein